MQYEQLSYLQGACLKQLQPLGTVIKCELVKAPDEVVLIGTFHTNALGETKLAVEAGS
jgi:hypothetical protein